MSARGRATRILCINCNMCVNNFRRYHALELDTRVITSLTSWVYPQIITEEDYVCEACRDLAMIAVNNNLQQEVSSPDGQEAGPSHRGHAHVCPLCGRSTLQRRSDKILKNNPTELQQLITDIIKAKIAPRLVTESDRVCHACWLRTRKEALRINVFDSARSPPAAAQELHQQLGLNDPGSRTVPQESSVQEPPVNELAVNEPAVNEPVVNEPAVIEPDVNEPAVNEPVLNEPENIVNIQNVVIPGYRRAANSNHHCVFPSCNSVRLHSISDKLRAIVLSTHNFYVPKLARVCDHHLTSNLWETLYESENSYEMFTTEQIQHVFSFVNAFIPTIDFENIQDIEDAVFEYWIGLTKETFNTIIEEVPRVVEIRRGRLGLAVLLLKMRTGDSDDRISTLVNIPRRTLENLMDKVREVLLQDFVPRNLGQLSREELLQHNLLIPNGLYGTGNNAIVICDGTYVYINKSSNYMFQKQSYSLHKYRNLLKPFLIVACDGYIVDCFGPYKAITSDADIMKNLFYEGSPLRSYFREGDVFILDRGFRDSITLLQECGYRTYMPDSLLEGGHQLTTVQANRSRCVTICRWVVEAVNGHFKRNYKLFRQEYFHRALPHMMQNFQIAAALLNRFGVRFQDNIYANEILDIIRERMYLENNLANMVETLNMNRRMALFQSITADRNNLLYFPTLEYRELILFALGTYQIRQARSYYGEHIRFHGGYRIEVSRENINPAEYNLRGDHTTLIRGRIKSRHVTRKQYYVYILTENNIPGRTGITEYCCNCLVGRRTVGCCAHVMTLVWYLGWARYQQNITAPAEFLDDIIVRDDEEYY